MYEIMDVPLHIWLIMCIFFVWNIEKYILECVNL